MAQAITIPDVLEVLIGEKLDLQLDFTNVIAAGDVISSPTATMTSLQNNETVPTALSTPTIITGNIVQLTLTTSKLRSKNDYVLLFSVIATGANTQKTPAVQLIVKAIQ